MTGIHVRDWQKRKALSQFNYHGKQTKADKGRGNDTSFIQEFHLVEKIKWSVIFRSQKQGPAALNSKEPGTS